VTVPGGTTSAGVTYNPSIDCTYTGTAAVVSTTGNITVSTTAPGGGVNLTTASGADTINWNSTAGTVTGSTQTNGPVIDATTTSGDIIINTAAVTGTSATVSHAIRARSTAGGDVTVTTAGNVSGTNSTSGANAIEAISTSGAVTVTTANRLGIFASQSDLVSGRLRGIYAQTGSGPLTLQIGTRVSSTAGTGSAAIEARTGTGPLTVNFEGVIALGSFNLQTLYRATADGGASGVGLLSAPGADAEINVGVVSELTGLWGLDATVAAGTTTTLNVANYHSEDLHDFWSTADGNVTRIRATGAGAFVANVNGSLYGAASLSGLSGGAEINILSEGVWWTQGGAVAFGSGDDRLITEPGDGSVEAIGGIVSVGTINPNFNGYQPDPVHVIDFGAGDDTFENGGYLMVSGAPALFGGGGGQNPRAHFEGETRFQNLETFVNSGVIFLGVRDDGSSAGNQSLEDHMNRGYHLDDVTPDASFGGPTDGFHDDILSLPGVTFVGDGGEIFFDINVNGVQSSCERDATTGELPAADCIIIAGGATEGVHLVRFEEPIPGDRGQYLPNGIVIAEVTGGTSAQGHFAMSPNMKGYSPAAGGIVDKGFYAYLIGYKEDTQQHVLLSLPGQNAFQLPLLAQGGHSLWRLSTGSWFDRQADIRGGYGGDDGAVWVRVSGETADRDVFHDVEGAGITFTYDNTFKQKSYAVTAGSDLLFSESDAMAVSAGVMLGYANSEFEYADSPNFARFDAWTLGAYGSVVTGNVFVDVALNANRAVVDNDVPAAQLFPEGTILSTTVLSVGGQVEAGWRIPVLAEGLFVEPLAGFSFVRSNWEDLYLPADDAAREGINAELGDPTSTRAGIGGRIGFDRDFGFMRAEVSALGRMWAELGEATEVRLASPGEDPTVVDDFAEQFNELSLGASVHSPGNMVSGFVRVGGRFADDYDARTASAGVRVAF
ncbi:MAG TPA: hypothetical protein VD906_03580, partial [Caulobacteraceae bacterium]|nr:hypothetical protein [Caulobacteraceae bacterium]